VNTPFLGGSYVSRSTNLADQRCVNLYLEMVETKDGKEAGGFYGTPGLKRMSTVGPGPIRGFYAAPGIPNQLFVISGNQVWVVGTDLQGLKLYGTLATSSGSVPMVANPGQLLIVDGVAGYVVDGVSQLLTDVLPGAIGVQPVSCAYQDGFAVIVGNNLLSQSWYQSDLNEFRNWQPLNFSSADGQSDPIISIFDIRREVWLLGAYSTEVWINGGLPGFTFQRLQGVFIEAGIAAAYSVARVGQGLMWLGRDDQGFGMVWQATGYVPQRVSTHAIETAIRGYSRIDDAIAYCYQDSGHVFYVLTFPTGNATWVYDATEGVWHERAAFANGLFGRHRSNCHAHFNGMHVVGDYVTGDLYVLDLDTYTDNALPKKWLRSWRALPAGAKRQELRFNALSIDCESGIGVPDNANPQIAMRYSDDGGHTWSNEQLAPFGSKGETVERVQWNRLGATRPETGLDRIFEISSSDPVKAALVGANIDAEPN
jgi:hypothetical protein